MRVIIVGASKVGFELTKLVCEEGYDVVVIDKDSKRIDEITDAFDCNGYVGNGSNVALLKKAGIDSASIFVAATKNDETNICCCNIAKQLGIRITFAAIRGQEHESDMQFLREKMGVDITINPDKAAAEEVNKLISYAGAVEIERFGGGKVNIATVTIESNSVLANATMPEVHSKIGAQILICAIDRHGKIITPKGKHQIKAGDQITFAAIGNEMDKALKQLGIIEKTVRRTVIVGGSKVGCFLAELLMEKGVKVTLVENNVEKCEELLEMYPKANVINGDGTDSEFIENELRGADSCVAVTGQDEENLVISMFAKSFGIQRIAAEIDNAKFEKMLKKSGINHVFSTQNTALSGIIKDARLLANGIERTEGSELKRLHAIGSGKLEAFEFEINDGFELRDIEFKDPKFELKQGVLIAVIIREQEAFVPDGSAYVKTGDRILVVSADHQISKLADIIA